MSFKYTFSVFYAHLADSGFSSGLSLSVAMCETLLSTGAYIDEILEISTNTHYGLLWLSPVQASTRLEGVNSWRGGDGRNAHKGLRGIAGAIGSVWPQPWCWTAIAPAWSLQLLQCCSSSIQWVHPKRPPCH